MMWPDSCTDDYADRADLIREHLDSPLNMHGLVVPGPDDHKAPPPMDEVLLTVKRMGAAAPFVGDPRTTYAWYEWPVALEGDRPVVTGSAVLKIERGVYW